MTAAIIILAILNSVLAIVLNYHNIDALEILIVRTGRQYFIDYIHSITDTVHGKNFSLAILLCIMAVHMCSS